MQDAIIVWFVVAAIALAAAWAWLLADDRKVRAAAESRGRACQACGKPSLAWVGTRWRSLWPAEAGYEMRCLECGTTVRFRASGEPDRAAENA